MKKGLPHRKLQVKCGACSISAAGLARELAVCTEPGAQAFWRRWMSQALEEGRQWRR